MSHLAGAIVFSWLSIYLLRPVAGCWKSLISVGVFVAAAVALLLISGVYHMFVPGGIPRAIMLRIDLVAIFILIAATFTPIHGLMFSGWRRWGVLVLVWSIAIGGSLARLIWFDSINRQGGALLFLSMGWIGGFTVWCLWQSSARSLILPAVAGGVLYSIGAIVNATGWPVIIPSVWGPHETMHLMVLAGLSCHWALVVGVIELSSLVASADDVSIQESPVNIADVTDPNTRAA